MQEKIRYGIIGFGGFAERAIAPAILASGNSELVAIQKRSLRAARQKAAEHNIPLAFGSVEEVVGQKYLDAVFIASANSRHCPDAVAAAKAGKHVLVEKPMAMSVAEAKKMIEVCKKSKVKLMVGHMIRFSPLTLRIKEIIRSGLLGLVTYVRTEFVYDARTSQRVWLKDMRVAGGGPVFDIGVHCLDTLRFILDAEVISVKSHVEPKPTKARTETTACLSLRLTGGILGSIYCSYASSIRRSIIEVMGTNGILSAANFTVGNRTIPLNVILGSGDETRTESINVPNLYVEEIKHFSSCILEDKKPMISGEEGLKNQKVLDAALNEERMGGGKR